MDWDMVIVTGALSGVLMLVIILGRIWQDRTPREQDDDLKDSHAHASQAAEIQKVTEQENSLA